MHATLAHAACFATLSPPHELPRFSTRVLDTTHATPAAPLGLPNCRAALCCCDLAAAQLSCL
eukprot:8619442-Alexandrium_andersonii.AAC.1